MPVEDSEEAEEESSSWSRIGEGLLEGCSERSSKIGGGSGGNLASLAFAKDF